MSDFSITKPGIYNIGEQNYHADNFLPAPSLSHSIMKVLLDRSPRHARAAHPRFGGDGGEQSKSMDAGSIIHKLILGRGADIVEITTRHDAKHKTKADQVVTDYRTDAAQAERDAIRAAGKLPVLQCELPVLRAAADSAIAQMQDHPDLRAFFAPGKSEAVCVWQENGSWMRCMIDRLPDDPAAPIFDLKCTGMSAAVETWERRLIHEYATQQAFYRRGVKAALGGKRRPFRFIVIEWEPPFGMSVMTSAPSLEDYAEEEVERGIAKWQQCTSTNTWPGYPAITAHIELPPYMETKKAERVFRESFAATGKGPADWGNPFYSEFGAPPQ